LAKESAALSNMRTGLLVEAVEGIETIKAGSGGWKFLSRWIHYNKLTIQGDLRMRNATEGVGYLSGVMQQMSYAGLVVAGSLLVMQGHMTMGALIACSILSGRILAPVLALPGLLVQHAHARAALEGLERLYSLQSDNHGIDHPLVPTHLKGHYQLNQVEFAYGQNPPVMVVPNLEIKPGESMAIVGPIGAGMSTRMQRRWKAAGKSRSRLLVITTIGNSLQRTLPPGICAEAPASWVRTGDEFLLARRLASRINWGMSYSPSSNKLSSSFGSCRSDLSSSSINNTLGRWKGRKAVPTGPKVM
jgi:hypothetical protein